MCCWASTKRAPLPRIPARRLTPEALRSGPLLAMAAQFGQETSGIRGRPLRCCSLELETLPRTTATAPSSVRCTGVGRSSSPRSSARSSRSGVRRIACLGSPRARDYDLGAVVDEGAIAAQHLLTMCIRAIDYTPPAHLTFGDYLSAWLLTADREMYPDGGSYDYPSLLTRGFADFGVRPSAAGNGGAWSTGTRGRGELSYAGVHHESLRHDRDEVFRFAWENRRELGLREDAYTRVLSARPVRAYRPRRRVHAPRDRRGAAPADRSRRGRTRGVGRAAPARDGARRARHAPRRGRAVFDEFGRLKYNIHNRIANAPAQSARLASLWRAGAFRRDRRTGELKLRTGSLDFALLHRALARRERRRRGGRMARWPLNAPRRSASACTALGSATASCSPSRTRPANATCSSTSAPRGVRGAGADELLRRVGADIAERCGGKLHAVVATHRHADHINGFAPGQGDGPGDIIRAQARTGHPALD